MRIATAEDAAALLRPFFQGAQEERVAVLHLDAERRVLGVTQEAAGGREEVRLPVAAILGAALKLGSHGIVVAHNHPGGDPQPSEGDRGATRSLAGAAAGIDIRLVDHLIFAGDDCVSLVALGLL
ncbi:MAG: JAB domain-containing protein [Alphaproteobacteria bacterium]|nr:JAB domain-containing protein [Alphaproteobacteria bacterium]MBV9371772.1 JAB domain-containing protein [Alphaproteobacteria bacterium]MBV9902444.1 JAB domain-containing protein [Alphaproteobacteria bacterium]